MNDDVRRSLPHLADQYVDQLVSFCQRLVQTPSLPGEEGDVAELIHAEMESLGYDDVWVDDWGNVVGLLKGQGTGASVMFNGHMDHVDPGDPKDWPYLPYSGEIHDGRLWGRGVADMKGPLAAMIYAGGVMAGEGIRPPGDLYVAGVVQEEVGGLGTQKLVQTVRPDLAVVGEATSNQLARGHRGRIELVVKARGKSVHASVPRQGVNPHAVLVRFIRRLESIPMRDDDTFGASTVAPTLYQTDQRSSNVVPGEARVHLDWRNVPGEAPSDVMGQLGPLLQECVAEVQGSQGELSVHTRDLRTYTGRTESFPAVFASYGLDSSHPLVQKGQQVLTDALSRPVEVMIWDFATDGGHLVQAGVPTIGFGPAEADKLHTVGESVPLDMLAEGLLGYVALALELGAVDTSSV
ncbi:MAG: M20/M25/M40 family metallo-hydrolase [Anaerolineae bacterium]|nr:M20/M25/M40 family metallo-hydrolase [Anaerolineae bacterium]NIQ82136.1 M20/M25/M40 family metallo-hydrolase [Anaerolineae bacterium]